jgi:tRNA-Thr(GGU) m(6)t(6)A37 methyltransferase TsaA
MTITYEPIGIIHSPFTEPAEMPIQPKGASGVLGHIDILPQFSDGLADLEGFSHIILLYHFHRVAGKRLRVTPFLDSTERGIFATRAPVRPNPIGISVVELQRIQGTRLSIANVDILDETPLLDIKPYVPEFDQFPVTRTGWLQQTAANVLHQTSDNRFK